MSSIPPETLGIRHVALRVTNLEACESFYTGILGYRVEWRPDPDNVYLTSGQDNLALHRDPAARSGSALDHFGIMLKKTGDVDTWAKHFKSHGVSLLKEPKTHRDGARSLYVADPEGNTLQFIHHPPITV